MCRNNNVLESLFSEREAGTIVHVGVSVYEPDELRYIIKEAVGVIDCVQIPFNIFNCASWISSGLISDAEKAGIKLLARSVYLQGVAFCRPDDSLVVRLGLEDALRMLWEISGEFGMSCGELAYAFAASTPGVDYVIVGCETIEQIRENAMLMRSGSRVGCKDREAILEMSESIAQSVLDPRRWALS